MDNLTYYKQWEKDIPAQFQGHTNINAIVKALGRQLDEVLQVNYDLVDKTDIKTATGEQLDMIGTIVNISRADAFRLVSDTGISTMDDEVYRAVLYFKALKNNSTATYADIMKGMHYLWTNEKIELTYGENTYEPAEMEIGVHNISTDDIDPMSILPMVIRAAGVKIFWEVSYLDPIYDRTWERFYNLHIRFEINHYYNGKYQYNGDIQYQPDTMSSNMIHDGSVMYNGQYRWSSPVAIYNKFNGEYKYNGVIRYSSSLDEMAVDNVDGILLNQAKRKMLRFRATGSDGWKITQIAFGTGLASDGNPYTPDPNQTTLRNELQRNDLQYVSKIDNTVYRYVGSLSEHQQNGQYISEIGLIDSEGDLVCVKTFRKKQKRVGYSMVFKLDDTCVED